MSFVIVMYVLMGGFVFKYIVDIWGIIVNVFMDFLGKIVSCNVIICYLLFFNNFFWENEYVVVY